MRMKRRVQGHLCLVDEFVVAATTAGIDTGCVIKDVADILEVHGRGKKAAYNYRLRPYVMDHVNAQEELLKAQQPDRVRGTTRRATEQRHVPRVPYRLHFHQAHH